LLSSITSGFYQEQNDIIGTHSWPLGSANKGFILGHTRWGELEIKSSSVEEAIRGPMDGLKGMMNQMSSGIMATNRTLNASVLFMGNIK
jgi:hypothetical protein